MGYRVQKSEEEWREALTEEQYHVTREKGTEPPFSGRYHDCHAPGTYRCVCCGKALFDSSDKFDSKTGWPSFRRPMGDDRLETAVDSDYGMVRTEIRCGNCGAHLGHLFDDGPPPEGNRYCINSVALDLEERSGGN